MGLKQWLFWRGVRSEVEEMKNAKAGPLAVAWQTLQGWKSIIVLLIAVAKLCFPDAPAFQYVGLAMAALGWNDVAPAADPVAVLAAFATLGTVFSAVRKAVKQHQAGVPLRFVNSIPPGAVDVPLLKTAAEVGAKVTDQGGLIVPQPGVKG